MKKMFSKWIALTLSLVMVLSLVACGGSSKDTADDGTAGGDSAEETYTLVAAVSDTDHEMQTVPSSMALQMLADNVEEKSGGRLKIDVFINGELGSDMGTLLPACQNGTIDIINLSPGNWGAYTNGFAALNIPFLFSGPEDADAFIDEYGPTMSETVLNDTQMHVLGYFDRGFRNLTSAKKQVLTLDDLKGMKLRVQTDNVQIAAWEALGASVIAIPFSELYTSLQQGMVDGQENPYSNIVLTNMWEVQDYLTITNHCYAALVMAISESSLQELPEDLQTLLLEEAAALEEWCRGAAIEYDDEILAELEEHMTVEALPAEQQAIWQEAASKSWSNVAEIIGQEELDKIIQIASET